MGKDRGTPEGIRNALENVSSSNRVPFNRRRFNTDSARPDEFARVCVKRTMTHWDRLLVNEIVPRQEAGSEIVWDKLNEKAGPTINANTGASKQATDWKALSNEKAHSACRNRRRSARQVRNRGSYFRASQTAKAQSTIRTRLSLNSPSGVRWRKSLPQLSVWFALARSGQHRFRPSSTFPVRQSPL